MSPLDRNKYELLRRDKLWTIRNLNKEEETFIDHCRNNWPRDCLIIDDRLRQELIGDLREK